MFKMMSMFLIFLMVSLTLMIISQTVSKKSINDREKSSPFECGFNCLDGSRLPFSIQFFLIGIIFLIFDVEISLILPLVPLIKISKMKFWFMLSLGFYLILIWGLYHEWWFGSLDWVE